ncbi:MAG TPA: thioesterase domain-containing protein, partial [Pseudomonadales bacterium]|nr:thioesterase domain-containing protein [Pseudomonadales bacterium]
FCFAYAGGSAAVFRDWYKSLPSNVEVCSIQLPGRGVRFREKAISCNKELIESLLTAIEPYLDVPFAFFGHSMGAQVAFELTRALRRNNRPQPHHLFVSGRKAPHLPMLRRPIHALPEVEFLAEIRRLNGTPAEAWEHPELISLMSPILRADVKLVETWNFESEAPLEIQMTVLGGFADEGVPRAQLEAWQQHCMRSIDVQMFSGDHFFINSSQADVLNLISNKLSAITMPAHAFRHLSRVGA